MSDFNPARGFGVYVHWPYCTRICPYCDFNVYAAKTRERAPLLDAILRDLEGWRERTGPRTADTVFLGGGTPSLLSAQEVGALIGRIDALWGLRTGAEITLEANPDEAAGFAGFRAAGVSRLSLGVQSLDDARLRFLGRTHTASAALGAFDQARGRFPSVSIDMIYAVPGQGPGDWGAELAQALGLGADHLSLYELSIEPGAAFFHAVRRRQWAPPDEALSAELYEMTQDMAEAAGYPAYEISNHARGSDHACVHNRIYWSSGDWVGVGPGAHGRLTAGGERLATEAADRPGDYQRLVGADGVGWSAALALSPLAQARERIAMGLRVSEGLALSDIEELGFSLDPARIATLGELGLLACGSGRLALTRRGRLLADRIAAELAP